MSVPLKESNMTGEPNHGPASGFCYSIEIKDSYLPPWIIASLCDYLDSGWSSYEARYYKIYAALAIKSGLISWLMLIFGN